MKRIFIVVLVLLFISETANAQSKWKEMLQQIAALQVYIGYAKKGYNIANKGINTFRNIKKGEFDLHQDFFNSLKNVNPAISNYTKVAEIIYYQVRVIKQSKQALQGIREGKQFTPVELDYCKAVFENLLNECVKTIDELLLVLTPGKPESDSYRMTDDERIKRIDKVYLDMQDKYSFCSAFSEEAGLLLMQRTNEQVQLNYSKLINGIK
jgi:hypothetical protein